MASILTEIYVSIDGVEYTKLDLYKDEAFVMKYSKKDLSDITKVNAPYSQNLSFPATPKNKQALGFFGNTQSVKINPDNKYFCKTYNNGQLSQKGILKLSSVRYKNKEADNFIGSFNTELLSLKDRIGDATLNDITTDDFSVSWRADNVFDRLKNTATVSSLTYYAPLFSNNRVLIVNQETIGAIDNVFYKADADPRRRNVLNIAELRPAVSLVSIFNLIKLKYNIPITIPLESNPILKDAYMWCNGDNFSRKYANRFRILNQFTFSNPTYKSVANLTDSSILITKSNDTYRWDLKIRLWRFTIGDDNDTANMVTSVVRKSTGETVWEDERIVANSDEVEMSSPLPLSLFTGNTFEFVIYIRFDKPVFWRTARIVTYMYHAGNVAPYVSSTGYADNIIPTGSHKVDLIQALPNMKVIDFLTSLIKTFNISVYDSSPNDDNLFFLTPRDLTTPAKSYTKSEADYTMYVDHKETTKTVNNPYNSYMFRHVVSKYRSNVDYKKQFGLEYGEATYPIIPPTKQNQFKIETGFSIIPPIKISASNIFSSYGFTSDAPTSIEDFFRYTPNLNEPTIFCALGNFALAPSENIGCQNVNASGVLVVGKLMSYMKTMPYAINNYTLAFSVLKIDSFDFPESLYKLFYMAFITRLLNPNALSQTFNITLPSSELYLNDAGVASGIYLTSKGFRLQNDIIIGETRFEILDVDIDLTTGKGKMTLLNY